MRPVLFFNHYTKNKLIFWGSVIHPADWVYSNNPELYGQLPEMYFQTVALLHAEGKPVQLY
jgi:hypothetical protein